MINNNNSKEKKPIKFISFSDIRKKLSQDELRKLAKEYTLVVKPNSRDFAFVLRNFDDD